MKSYTLKSFKSETPCVCALGCFDGVHIGHTKLINHAKHIAAELAIPCAVWSFEEPPKNYFLPKSVPLITTPTEKHSQMRALKVDILISVPFDESIASMSAEDFFEDILIKKIKAAHIVCGFNYRFGRGGKGDTRLLSELCKQRGIGLSVISPVCIENMTVSSSKIRAVLENGQPELACALMGRPSSLSARIVDGQHLGRKLGFPTLNQSFTDGKLVPKNGVYVTRVSFEKKQRYGITNVGLRPTVDGNTLCAETNVFDFAGDLYGKTVRVEFLEFIRPEKKFSSVEELSAQVHSDIEKAREIIKKY